MLCSCTGQDLTINKKELSVKELLSMNIFIPIMLLGKFPKFHLRLLCYCDGSEGDHKFLTNEVYKACWLRMTLTLYIQQHFSSNLYVHLYSHNILLLLLTKELTYLLKNACQHCQYGAFRMLRLTNWSSIFAQVPTQVYLIEWPNLRSEANL